MGGPPDRQGRQRSVLVLAVCALVADVMLAGCGAIASGKGHNVKTQDQVYSEAVTMARQVVEVTGMRVIDAHYMLNSCNDQGDPPYRAKVIADFDGPTDQADSLALTEQYRVRLVKSGWSSEGAGVSHATVSLARGGYLLQMDAPRVAWNLGGTVPAGDLYLNGPCSRVEGVSSIGDAPVGSDVTALLK